MGRNQRRFFRVVDPRFQREFIYLAVFIASMSSLIVLTGAWFIIQDYKSLIGEVSATLGSNFFFEASSRVNKAWMMVTFACVINVATIALLAFAFSTRVAGVLFRLQKELNAYADDRETTEIVPRENDFFPDLVAAANRVLKKKGPKGS